MTAQLVGLHGPSPPLTRSTILVSQAGLAETARGRIGREVFWQGLPQDQAGQYRPPLPLVQSANPASSGRPAAVRVRVEEGIHDTSGTEVGQATRPAVRPSYAALVNTDGPKGKNSIHGRKSPAERLSPQNTFRLCVRCKAGMTKGDWDALLIGMPKEAKKRIAFIDLSAGSDHRAH